MLEILSENQDLKTQVEEAERMLTEIDIERSAKLFDDLTNARMREKRTERRILAQGVQVTSGDRTH